MSSSLIRAHGGPAAMLDKSGGLHGLFVTDTMVGLDKEVREKHLDQLISNTTGVQAGSPVMAGIITDTMVGMPKDDTETVHKVAKPSKTEPKRFGQVPFAGPKY